MNGMLGAFSFLTTICGMGHHAHISLRTLCSWGHWSVPVGARRRLNKETKTAGVPEEQSMPSSKDCKALCALCLSTTKWLSRNCDKMSSSADPSMNFPRDRPSRKQIQPGNERNEFWDSRRGLLIEPTYCMRAVSNGPRRETCARPRRVQVSTRMHVYCMVLFRPHLR